MKIKSFTDKITVAVVYMLLVEIAISIALAINFMYDYHFFAPDSDVFPIQKSMDMKTDIEYENIRDYITFEIKAKNKEKLSVAEQSEYNDLKQKYSKENTNLIFYIESENGDTILSNDSIPEDFCFKEQTPFSVYIEGTGTVNGTIHLFVRSENSMHVHDGYRLALKMIDFAHSVKYLVFVILFILIFLCAFLLGWLMSNIGTKPDTKAGKAYIHFIDRIPFDLLTLIAISLIGFVLVMILLTSAADIKENSIVLWNVVILILTFVNSFILLVYCLTLAARIKLGHILQNTLIYRLISKIMKRGSSEDKGSLKVPILGKTIISIGSVMILELVSIFYFVFKYKTCSSGRLEDFKFLYFAFAQLIVLFVLAALYFMIVLNLNRVRESGKRIAEGDFDSVADSHIMFGDFKAINEDLISIKDDMISALEEKNKSQEMRNELITNISHDIKTPLTSIINYTDIISSGKCSQEDVKSYAEIISKQSAKLSDLLRNLIEVSRISTGNIEVNLDAVNVELFLTQTIEEFSLRFDEKNLLIESSMPEEDTYINADGLKLWRVFENLFSNICKYAMPNTRVYLDVENSNGKTSISLKNITEKPINSTADELLLRFKREDSSRHTEGNGLGLSIAKSFTEVQGGTFEISVDGDLFKSTITFDTLDMSANNDEK